MRATGRTRGALPGRSQIGRGSGADRSTTSTRARQRLTCRRNRCPRPLPSCAPSTSPGTSATTNRSSSPATPRFGARVVKDSRRSSVRGRQRGEQRRLARVGQADQSDVGDDAELDGEPLLLPKLAAFGTLRDAIARGGERAFPTTAPAARDHRSRSLADEVGQQAVLVLDPRPVGDPDHEVLALGPGLAPLAARATALRTQVRMVGEPREVTHARGPRRRRRRRGRRRRRRDRPGVVRLAQDRRRAVAAVAPARARSARPRRSWADCGRTRTSAA